MTNDPYKTLGLSKEASQDDIQKAYRKLAKELHPDLRPGDKKAEEQFKAVSAAYALLKDPEQRAKFDRGEIDASGMETPEHAYYRRHADQAAGGKYASSSGYEDFVDISDIFSNMFGRNAGRGQQGFSVRGQDHYYTVQVDFLDAATGKKQRLTLPDGQTIDLSIPVGVADGTMLRLKGKGGPGIGGAPAGDALVEVSVNPHPHFTRDGNDILTELPISLDEAVLGGKVTVQTISGRVAMTVPPGSTTGDVLRLKGKGLAPAGGKKGDHHVRLKIVMPKKVDDDLTAFFKDWREKHSYDPRSASEAAS